MASEPTPRPLDPPSIGNRSLGGTRDAAEPAQRARAGVADIAIPEREDLPPIGVPPPRYLRGAALDHFLALRNRVLDQAQRQGVKVIGVSSARPGEGKTTVSICLASAFAMACPQGVLLVDANLRKPAIHRFYRMPRAPGLADVIQGDFDWTRAVTTAHDLPLQVLAAGSRPATSPAELFVSSRFEQTIAAFKSRFDFILVDTPNLHAYQDAELMGKHFDGTILVVESDRTQLAALHHATRQMEAARIPVLGLLLNRHKKVLPGFLERYLGVE
ncbi:MAG: CpsD/CapB family tyrosine-protein kinase [bacterium]